MSTIQRPSQLPIVAIVGRPNVGKSSLLNALAGRRVSIVHSTPGVTRDRVSTIIAHEDVILEAVDTGGIGIVDRDDLEEHIERQIAQAVRDASAIVFLTDAQDGVTALDREVARRLRDRAREIPLFLVVNKVDSPRWEAHVPEFFELGLGEPMAVSAQLPAGTTDLLDAIVAKLPPTGEVDVEPVLHLAVVGRPNVGKSTFVNALALEERVIVSEVPGTTRDAVDVHFEKDGRRYVVIDTAGVRHRPKLKSSVEFYSQMRMQDAVRRANVVLLLLDATQEVARLDKSLATFVQEEHKLCIIVVNKWDLTGGKVATEEFAHYLFDRLRALRQAPIAFVTAKDARNIQAVVDLAQSLYKRSLRRVGTGELNRVLEAVEAHHRPRSRGGKSPRMYYATQISVAPPTFVVFVNDPESFPEDYRRYLHRALQEALDLEEIPLRIFLRTRSRKDPDAPPTAGAARKARPHGEGAERPRRVHRGEARTPSSGREGGSGKKGRVERARPARAPAKPVSRTQRKGRKGPDAPGED